MKERLHPTGTNTKLILITNTITNINTNYTLLVLDRP